MHGTHAARVSLGQTNIVRTTSLYIVSMEFKLYIPFYRTVYNIYKHVVLGGPGHIVHFILDGEQKSFFQNYRVKNNISLWPILICFNQWSIKNISGNSDQDDQTFYFVRCILSFSFLRMHYTYLGLWEWEHLESTTIMVFLMPFLFFWHGGIVTIYYAPCVF